MIKIRSILLGVLASAAPVLLLVIVVAYAYQRTRFTQRVNASFDPKEKAFRGIFLPWPVGRPTLAGGLDPETDRRIRILLGHEVGAGGSVRSNSLSLILHDSDGTFLVHAD